MVTDVLSKHSYLKHFKSGQPIEPRHDKTNIMGLRPAWIQTSLPIRAV
jgi:hypothetical protein